MRKFLLGLATAATLGVGALAAAQPVEAQPYYPGYYRPYHRPYYGPPRYRPAMGPGYYPRRGYGYYRPGPRCWTRMDRYWNGFVWVQRPIRVCR